MTLANDICAFSRVIISLLNLNPNRSGVPDRYLTPSFTFICEWSSVSNIRILYKLHLGTKFRPDGTPGPGCRAWSGVVYLCFFPRSHAGWVNAIFRENHGSLSLHCLSAFQVPRETSWGTWRPWWKWDAGTADRGRPDPSRLIIPSSPPGRPLLASSATTALVLPSRSFSRLFSLYDVSLKKCLSLKNPALGREEFLLV